ncbi:MAG: sulfite exporter TauE/SafE family protein [Clostridiales bacterium]|jgi:uncharacterized membrane protein YfcA|nr:sulfite exporter TauE/SafE family protein [Clostridiales bacterium]
MTFILIILIGLVSGIITGLGFGGGMILIPALDIFLNFEQKTSQTMNLICYIPAALISSMINTKNKNIDFKIFIKVIFIALIGNYFGTMMAISLNVNTLKKIFGIFLFVIGVREMFLA